MSIIYLTFPNYRRSSPMPPAPTTEGIAGIILLVFSAIIVVTLVSLFALALFS